MEWISQYLTHHTDNKKILAMGIGRSLAAPPSHTTVHTGPYTAIRLIRAGTDKTGSALPGFFSECDVTDLSATAALG